jgi:sugar phosphate isomerase/epimerase
MHVDRRSLLTGLATLAATAAARVHGLRAQPARRWGVQLYTVREQITRDPKGTLRQIAALGYKELEVLQPTLSTVAPIAASLGLALTSVHLDGPTEKGEGFEAFLAQAKRVGLQYVVVAYIPPAEQPADRAGFDAIAARLSRMARSATAAGLRLCYHNHAFEFGPDGTGMRWLDVLMRGTAEAGMQLQLDVFWASIGGVDPVALIRQYKGRIASLHLKDKHPRAATSLVENDVARTDFVEVGSGALDFPAILAAARQAGVQHYFVEQDETPGDPIESLKKSYAYLAGLKG